MPCRARPRIRPSVRAGQLRAWLQARHPRWPATAHQSALLAARRLFLVIWHLANGLPDEGHLGQLRAFTGS